jgi:OmpA-OmpF porin, OOP family
MRIAGLAIALAVMGLMGGPALAQIVEDGPQTIEEFISVLKPAEAPNDVQSGIRTRSLAPTTGAAPEAGTAGSGRVPDLQILFEFNSDRLTDQARERLDVLGAALASDELRPFGFEIAGHTDAVGSPNYNLELSRRRAEAVVSYLVQRWGIDRSRLEAQGFGMSRLIVPTDGANARNRRVEVQTKATN